ncbi:MULTISPECIES: hypothetical protein [Cyanophyceae]|uniref:hypothetical protein n=1 Tax=Cyanophyceae TaxID=3028117 RepID=UPI0016870D70|nr:MULTISPECIES: hypothetical protein [Cyanophyceae]MBD1918300.1 hypothetical protein [Phormidium sp. FACHB-77]MBD2028816.1 hypothetical protein [Phormidium sp. FACHB-322]MBD2051237.1 hypothetical protein [Leptolyngbya sp. FACHB-60]
MFDAKSELPPDLGGFAQSKPEFAYPEPDLSSLHLLGNMDNIGRIKRQLHVFWPEFSWETIKGDPDSRCFQRFAHDISSIGYDNRGRIWSIVCPQQGACIDNICCFNVEITVTGQRGWVDEPNREIAADMSVMGKVWFSQSSHEKWWVKEARDLFQRNDLPFPFSKEYAINISTHKVGEPCEPIFPIRRGLSERFKVPTFSDHEKDGAFSFGHIDVEIGDIVPTDHPTVNDFNAKIIELFNLATGNMLLSGNILTWNLWFHPPEGVDTEQWKTHALRWRESIDSGTDHAHDSAPVLYADGSPFEIKRSFQDLLKETRDANAIAYDLLRPNR